MEEVGGVVDEEGAAKVRHYDLRSLFSRLRPEGFERHHVLKWLNCKYFTYSTEEATFNLGLKIIFFTVLTVALINIILFGQIFRYIFNQTWLFGYFPIGPKGIVLLFVVVLVVAVFVTNPPKMSRRSAPPTKQQVQTVSAPVQQV